MEKPIREIVNNAGLEGSVVINEVKEGKGVNYGFNAATEVYEDLVKAGVIDPTKVTRVALENAASVAGLPLMTEACIFEKEIPMMPPGGGMGDMY